MQRGTVCYSAKYIKPAQLDVTLTWRSAHYKNAEICNTKAAMRSPKSANHGMTSIAATWWQIAGRHMISVEKPFHLPQPRKCDML